MDTSKLNDILSLVKTFTDSSGKISVEQLSALLLDDQARTVMFDALNSLRAPKPLIFGTRECPNCGHKSIIYKQEN